MRYDAVDPGLFIRTRSRLSQALPPHSLAIIHSNDLMPTNADGTFPFKQNSDLYYLSGIDQEETILLIFPNANNEDEREILFIRDTNEHLATWEGQKLTKEQASSLSGIQHVEWTSRFQTLFTQIAPQAQCLCLPTNEHPRSLNTISTRNELFLKECKRRFPLHTYTRLTPIIAALRTNKDPAEISQIRKAISITASGFQRALRFVKPGVGEWEIEAEWAHEFLRLRSRGFAYQPIIASGKNACTLHYTSNSSLCHSGELLLMDVGAEWANWNADLTRTIPVNGRFTPRQKQVYQAVLNVLRYASSILRPCITLTTYQQQVLQVIEEELIRLGLITNQEAREQNQTTKPLVRKYFPHGTSHHLGLDVHDVSPPGDTPVSPGMVFTVEPGIYIPQENLGIRLENNLHIGEHENTDLFSQAGIPIEPEEIEEAMNP